MAAGHVMGAPASSPPIREGAKGEATGAPRPAMGPYTLPGLVAPPLGDLCDPRGLPIEGWGR